jgi:class 3 adenylate cyclase
MSAGDGGFEEATKLAEAALVELQKQQTAAEARTAAANVDVVSLLDEIKATAKEDLATPVEISPAQGMPTIATLPLEKNKDGRHVWREIADASVVATDLKGSTSISYSKQDRVGARLYQASTGGCSRVFQKFAPDFVDIQGDGLFAIFAGDNHSERALCAAVSLNSFGLGLRQMLKDQFGEDVPEMNDSGLKIGADTGLLLVKKIGVRGDHNEPVWAGRPVNYATKCAAETEAGKVLVTSAFFKPFLDNQYVRYTCGCVNGEPDQKVSPLWLRKTVDSLGSDTEVRELKSSWCARCGREFARAILRGDQDRGLNTGQLAKWRVDPAEEPADAAA